MAEPRADAKQVATQEDPVLVESAAGDVAIVSLNRPQVMNAMNTQLAARLVETLGALAGDSRIRVVILTGVGDRAFCAGADLKERLGMTPEQWRSQHVVFEQAFASLREFPKPIFSAVNGVASGGGCEIAFNTDFAIAAEGARFGQPEVRLGIMPGGGGTQLLPRRMPLGLARQLLMTGELIDAATALRAGLINSVHPAAGLMDAAIRLAETIAKNSPAAVREVRAAIDEGLSLALPEAVAVELRHYERMVDHPDRYEGVTAYNERRQPRFQDPRPPQPA